MDQHVQYFQTPDGTRIAYAELGSGPPLVWTPGWVSHLETEWRSSVRRPSVELLASRVTLIRHDKRGTGMSSWRAGDYSLEAVVGDLEALVAHLGLDTFALGGLSEGGTAAVLYAARHPERVTKLVLCGAYADGSGLMAPPELRQAIRTIVKTQWGVGSKVLAAMFLGEDSNVTPERFGAFQRASASEQDALAILDRAINVDIRGVLGEIRVPTLVYHNRDDAVVPIRLGQELAAGIAGSLFVSAPGAHHPSARGWDEMTRTVLAFLHDEPVGADPPRGVPAGTSTTDGHSGEAGRGALYDDGSLVIDAERHTITLNGQALECSPTEFRLLVALATSPGRIHSYAELLHRVWGAEYVGETDFLHVYVSRLRKKLGPDAIRTERGFGYGFRALPERR